MQDSRAALTAKEKETLRLIVRGHDAKSAARELDLSVHTINERLRNSRRKLGVTSSREAARLLLEAEAETPKNLAYMPLGDANARPSVDHSPTTNRGKTAAIWIGGTIMMSTIALIAAFALNGQAPQSALVSDRPAGQRATAIEAVQLEEFEIAARDWLALVDAEDWAGSYAAAGASFREPNTVATWREASQLARTPLGPALKRETATADYVNAPPRGYVIVRFRTNFENGAEAIESVTLENEDGDWKVVGYLID